MPRIINSPDRTRKRTQAETGRVPCLRVGKTRYLFNVEDDEQAIAEMAARGDDGEGVRDA